MSTTTNWLELKEIAAATGVADLCAPMCTTGRGTPGEQAIMGAAYFVGPAGSIPRRPAPLDPSSDRTREQLLVRVRELEALCTDVLVAGVDLGLPQALLNRLWGAVGQGDLPSAFDLELPAVPAAAARPEAADGSSRAALSAPAAAPADVEVPAPNAPELMPIPDIPLSVNPLRAHDKGERTGPPLPELKPLAVTKTVIVVDDDPMMLEVLSRILQRENFELLMASSGPDVLQKIEAREGDVDLLVTDYAMPEMQGRELAESLRARYPALKVLYQTGFSDRLFEDRVELEEGAAFLEKPFTARGLREAARLVLFGMLNP